MNRSYLIVSVVWSLAVQASAADLEPTLGKKGSQILAEKFDKAELPKGWTNTVGSISVAEGALVLGESAKDKHAGAFRKSMPLQNFAVQLDFKFEGAKMFHLGFDPSAGELNKKGHLYSLVINPDSWSILEHSDKADPNSKNVVRAKSAAKFQRGQWYTLLLENKGSEVVAQVRGHEPLKAIAADFAVKKPGLVFRVGGSDDQKLHLDNIHVWGLE